MEIFDVAIIGGGPAGSSCAAFCALAGLHTLVLERERFPREKVCGDCLNPSSWPVLERLALTRRVLDLPHSKLTSVEFIAIDGHKVVVDLPTGDDCEISVKRSLFDDLVLRRAREVGALVREETIVTALDHNGDWKIATAASEGFHARALIAADGRNSTVHGCAICCLALRANASHCKRTSRCRRTSASASVLQFLREGYSGQAPVNKTSQFCLVGTPPTISGLRQWAQSHFEIAANQPWRTITPLTRAPVPAPMKIFFS